MDSRLRFVLVLAIAAGLTYFRIRQRAAQRAAHSVPSAVSPRVGSAVTRTSLADARRAHPTRLVRQVHGGDPVDVPEPADPFDLVHYPAKPGPLAAYVSKDPHDGKRHPAIVWITGGDCNSIGDVWHDADRDNDQTAAAYRRAGVVLMVASLRGGNDNPGSEEQYFGETDDVLAAADYLSAVPWVDPARVYLGGHSNGANMALVTAEVSDRRFRAVITFGAGGAISGPTNFRGKPWPFDPSDKVEFRVRSPAYWLSSLHVPTFLIEGDGGNADSARWMRDHADGNANLHIAIVPGKTHFSVLGPGNDVMAAKVAADTGPTCGITLTDADVRAMAGR